MKLDMQQVLRRPSDIPNQEGFRFVGITKDGQFIWLCVQKTGDGSCTLGGDNYSRLSSWITVENFQKYILPAVEVVK